MSERPVGLVLPVLCLVLGLVAAARPQQDLSPFYDTVEVHVVNIEVMVTDALGRPVTGLTREDFELYEDGEPVELTNFFAVEGRRVVGAGEQAPAAAGGIAPTPETQRLHLVVFIDNFNLRPEHRNLIFDNLRQYLHTRLDPRDRVMLVTFNDAVEVAERFTNDTSRLLARLDELEEQVGRQVQFDAQYRLFMRQLQQASLQLPGQGSGPDSQAFDMAVEQAKSLAREIRVLAEQRHAKARRTVAALQDFADSLAGLRGRKALLYVSDGVPLQAAESLVEAWVGKYESWMMDSNLSQSEFFLDMAMLNSLDLDASAEIERVAEHASASGVSFYPISVDGGFAESYVSAEFVGGSAEGGPGSLAVTTVENFTKESSLLQLADGTGGVAFTRSANIDDLLDQVVQDFEAFYSLGYSPPGGPDGEYHEVEVKLKQNDETLSIRYLKGHRQKDPMAHLQDLTLSALHYDIDDNPLEVSLDLREQIESGRDRYRVSVMIKIPFERLLLLPQEKFHIAQVSVFVVAGDDSGRISPFRRIELPIRIPNEQALQALSGTAAYPLELEMRSGRQRLAVGVRDHLARVDATLCVDLTVGEEADQAALSRRAALPGED